MHQLQAQFCLKIYVYRLIQNSPDKFIKEIVDQVNPDLILIGEIKNSKLINFLKEKFIL